MAGGRGGFAGLCKATVDFPRVKGRCGSGVGLSAEVFEAPANSRLSRSSYVIFAGESVIVRCS